MLNLKMTKTLGAYCKNLTECTNRLKSGGYSGDDELTIALIYSALPARHLGVRTALEVAQPPPTLQKILATLSNLEPIGTQVPIETAPGTPTIALPTNQEIVCAYCDRKYHSIKECNKLRSIEKDAASWRAVKAESALKAEKDQETKHSRAKMASDTTLTTGNKSFAYYFAPNLSSDYWLLESGSCRLIS
jgi:hypothetical protein